MVHCIFCIFSVQSSVMFDFLRPYGLQHARPLCLSPTLGACSNSCPLSQWYHPTISSSVVPFSSSLQSFPASGSFPRSQFFPSVGQRIGVSASASVFPMNIQDWFPLGLTGWISLQSKGLSRVFSNTTVVFLPQLFVHFTTTKITWKKIQQVRVNKIVWGGGRNIFSLTWLKNCQCKVGKSRPEGVFSLLFSSSLQTRYLPAPRQIHPLGHHWGVYLCGSKVWLSLFCVWVHKVFVFRLPVCVWVYLCLCVCMFVCLSTMKWSGTHHSASDEDPTTVTHCVLVCGCSSLHLRGSVDGEVLVSLHLCAHVW